jgi:hypothetical protein
MGMVFVGVAVFSGAWSYWVAVKRREMIVQRSGKDFDFLVGPLVVSAALGVALVVNFVFAVGFFFFFLLFLSRPLSLSPFSLALSLPSLLLSLSLLSCSLSPFSLALSLPLPHVHLRLSCFVLTKLLQYQKAFGHEGMLGGMEVPGMEFNASVGGEMGELRI